MLYKKSIYLQLVDGKNEEEEEKRRNLFSFIHFSNMYSHVLAAYQKTLLVFWAKTSKTMSAVAESFKGYQYYEFTVIKDLAEPSRLLAEKVSRLSDDKTKEKETDDALIDINESNNQQITSDNLIQKGTMIRSIEFLFFLF
jgi:hypothetical protein